MLGLLGLALTGPTQAQVNVLTQHDNNQRTGANLGETILNTHNVNPHQFGRLFARHADGQIYAQPLYVSHLSVPGKGTHNTVFVATEHNSVYAYDADDPAQSVPLWHVNLGPSAPTPNDDFGNSPDYGRYHDLFPEIGITSTPVIDTASHTIYLTAFNRLGPGRYIYRLHALDDRTGEEKPGSPVAITAAVKGTGDGSRNGTLTFDPMLHLQRPGLLLVNGVVYLGFGAHADCPPNHGWFFGYDARTLKRTSVFCTTPNGTDGGIWMAGQGPLADPQGNIYLATGNGTSSAGSGGSDYGQCYLKLAPSPGKLTVADWFIPYNADQLSERDADLGGAGPLYVPDFPLLIGGGKSGVLYVLNRGSLGHFHADEEGQTVQSFQACAGHIHGSPVYWNGATSGPLVYVWSEHDYLKAFKIADNKLQTTPTAQGTDLPGPMMPGGFLSISANGNKAGTGVLWATTPVDDDANYRAVAGVLRAYDAADVSKELWNSLQNPARDDFGKFAKFCPPTVVNGKVYLATFSNKLVVYGLLGQKPKPVATGTMVGHRTARRRRHTQ